jgi:pyruvate kinase
MKRQRTKIVATIGPASNTKEKIVAMMEAGMDVCRINFSHGDHATHRQTIETIKAINEENNQFLTILADLQGPKIRLGDFEIDPFIIEKGQKILFTNKEIAGNREIVSIRYETFPQDVKAGEKILIDDGKLALKVLKTNKKDEVQLEALNTGLLSPRKGVNFPNTTISLSSLTEKDLNDLDFILRQEVHWIALSFVRSANDICELRKHIDKRNLTNKPRIIAKIEKPQALENIEEIIRESDGIMVARGDLGVEIPLEKVPFAQKHIIDLCNQIGRPVIVATQMMEAMINNIRPTRAEVNDVANSALDGADALMLSGETSVGDYPVETVQIMNQIIRQVEAHEGIYYKQVMPISHESTRYDTDAVLYSACELAQVSNATALAVVTHSGYSSIKLSSFRPKAAILVFSKSRFILSQMSLLWGIQTFYNEVFEYSSNLIEELNCSLLDRKIVRSGDKVINILSMPYLDRGISNTLKISTIR